MSGFLSRRLARRNVIVSGSSLAAVGVASAAALSLLDDDEEALDLDDDAAAAASDLPPAVETLQHDEVQEQEAFARGTFHGVELEDGRIRGGGTFVSEVIESPFTFTHAIMRWRGDLRGASFEFRTSVDGLTWPEWRTPEIEAASIETDETEALSGLVGTPRHRFLQYKARLSGDAAVSRVTAIFLNTKDGPRAPALVAREHGKPASIDFSRAEWGCDERVRFEEQDETWPREFALVRKLVVHHTVTPEDYDDGAAEVRAIYHYHTRILGWGDIGYNALVDRFGRSYEGRYGRDWPGGRQVFGSGVVGAHASRHNAGSLGIALVGMFHGEGAPDVPEPMLQRLVDVLEDKARENSIDPLSASDFLTANGDLNPDLPNIAGHRDCGPTACPGDNAYHRLDEVRHALADRLAIPRATAG